MAETPVVPPKTEAPKTPEAAKSKEEQLVDKMKVEAEAKAKIQKLKADAAKKLAEAQKAAAEAEAILYADWGPGKSGTRSVIIDIPEGVEFAIPRINGKEMRGRLELTYDTYVEVQRMISFRNWQEEAATKGYHKGVKVQNITTGQVQLVDTWTPDPKMVSSS